MCIAVTSCVPSGAMVIFEGRKVSVIVLVMWVILRKVVLGRSKALQPPFHCIGKRYTKYTKPSMSNSMIPVSFGY